MFRRIVAWGVGVAIWWTMGCLIGMALDHLLWHVSFNYLYSPHEFSRRYFWGAMATAAIVAAGASTGSRTPARVVWLVQSAAVCILMTSICSVIWALMAAWFASTAVDPPNDVYLAPVRRVRFCSGLWHGATFGFAVGSLLALVWIRGRRRMVSVQSSHDLQPKP